MSDFAIATPSAATSPQVPIHTVGILGGGQLAWMLNQAAPSLDLNLVFQTPNPSDSALQSVVDLDQQAILAPITDVAATAHLAQHCQIITFENEFVDLDALGQLAAQGVCFRPSLASLTPLLDKYEQRTFFASLGIAVPQFAPLTSGSLPPSFEFPVVIKARRNGYDGQGTFVCHTSADLAQCWQQAQQDPSMLMVEAYVPFQRELAVMAARSTTGEISQFPVVETHQQDQVCHWAIAPVQLSSTTQAQIDHITSQILEHLDMVGIVGIELFQTADDQVWVNEIAPRTHNSGHLTIDACATSQFEQHLRAISGQPLGPTHLTTSAAVMVNLLGFETSHNDYLQKRQAIAALPQTSVHWYGKTENRPGRKLGHATMLLSSGDPAIAVDMAHKIETLWYTG